MQRRDSRLLLSATDLVNFHECEHLSALDRAALDDEALKAQRTKPDDQAELFFRKGREFEASYLEELKRLHPGAGEVVEIANPFKDPGKAAAETLAAMRAGASIIYQATFLDGDLVRSVSLWLRPIQPLLIAGLAHRSPGGTERSDHRRMNRESNPLDRLQARRSPCLAGHVSAAHGTR